MTEQQLMCELVEVRIKRYLFKHKRATQAVVWHNCGLGTTPHQYLLILEKLESQGLIHTTAGPRRVMMLNWVEQPSPEIK